MSQVKRRARTAAAKLDRRGEILAAAERALEHESLDGIRMAGVAAEAGLAKGTLYLYFKTKEELLLALFERALDAWLDELDRALAGGQGWMPASALADVMARSLGQRPLLRRLLARQGPILEYNLDPERALRFKWRFVSRLGTTGGLLERRAVYLHAGDGLRLLLHVQALVAGLQTLAEPAPAVAGVLDAPGLEPLRLEFGREFRIVAGALLTGLERTN